jgi:hypothetical protein
VTNRSKVVLSELDRESLMFDIWSRTGRHEMSSRNLARIWQASSAAGHDHLLERALSCRRFPSSAATAGAVVESSLLRPGFSSALANLCNSPNGNIALPKPISGSGVSPFHVFLLDPNNSDVELRPSQTSMAYLIGACQVQGAGNDNNRNQLLLDCDTRFMKGVYLAFYGKTSNRGA